MLRWLVRKVVQYVIEEIEVRRAVQGARKASTPALWGAASDNAASSAKDVDAAVTKETMRNLVSAATRGSTIEMSELKPGKAVVTDGGKSKETVERLAGLGT